MSCEICGRNNCIRSFHSLEEQSNFDDIADHIKDRMRETLISRIQRLDTIVDYDDVPDDSYHVKLDDVIEIINDY